MTGLEAPVWIVAGSASIAFLAKAALWGKEMANGKRDPTAGFRESDRERTIQAIANAQRERASLIGSLAELRDDTKEQTLVLQEMRDDLREFCTLFKSNIPR